MTENGKLVEIFEKSSQESKHLQSSLSEKDAALQSKISENNMLQRDLEDLRIQTQHEKLQLTEFQAHVAQLKREFEKEKSEKNKLKLEFDSLKNESLYNSRALSHDIQKIDE